MKLNKGLLIILSLALLVSCRGAKDPVRGNPKVEPQSTIYLEEISGPDPDFKYFHVIDKSSPKSVVTPASYAVAKVFTVDPDGEKFLGGTNPSVSFHKAEETLVVRTRLISKPITPDYIFLTQASQAKEKLSNQKPEEEFGFLFTSRRLDLPFIVVDTYRGKSKISQVVSKLLAGSQEDRSVTLHLQRKGSKDNPFDQAVTLKLNSSLKEDDLPKDLLEYIRN